MNLKRRIQRLEQTFGVNDTTSSFGDPTLRKGLKFRLTTAMLDDALEKYRAERNPISLTTAMKPQRAALTQTDAIKPQP